MIVDGRVLAQTILDDIRATVLRLSAEPSFLAITVAPSAATESYLKMKRRQASAVGIRMEVKACEHATSDELIALLRGATHDAVIVQLPLPDTIDTPKVLNAIPLEKDADVLGAVTREKNSLVHPVAAAIKEILQKGSIDPRGKRATVVGNGWLVGAPAAAWLTSVGALVTSVTLEHGDLKEALRTAEIIVSGAGSAGLIAKEDITPGAAVIDIGTSELGGSIVGDVQSDVQEVAGLFTPVPGGVGPLTVAFLLQNVVALAEKKYA